MSEFSADWLQLREAADAQARAGHLLDVLAESEPAAGADDGCKSQHRFSEILDLGAGTGANLRYLTPRLGSGQRWRCIDQDLALLSQLPELTAGWARRAGYQVEIDPDGLRLAGLGWSASARAEQRDLATALHLQVPREKSTPSVTPLALPAGALVTASALLDLVTQDWLASLIGACRSSGCALLFALSYDGRARLTPARHGDRLILELVNRHQRGDKGFGPALGPSAAEVADRLLAMAGYRCWSASSDWQIGPSQAQLQAALIAGWLEAALELAPRSSPELRGWHRARQAEIEGGGLEIQVGHRDLVALPPASR